MKDKKLEEIFDKVSKRICNRKESLSTIKFLQKEKIVQNIGIEGWLKVEVVEALGEYVKKIRNENADLVVEYNGEMAEIELKGMSNCNFNEQNLTQADIYLFLADGESRNVNKLDSLNNWKLIGRKDIKTQYGKWIIFMVKKKL